MCVRTLYGDEPGFKCSPLYLLALEDEKDGMEDILTLEIKWIFSSLIAALFDCTLNSQSVQSSDFQENSSQVATSVVKEVRD